MTGWRMWFLSSFIYMLCPGLCYRNITPYSMQQTLRSSWLQTPSSVRKRRCVDEQRAMAEEGPSLAPDYYLSESRSENDPDEGIARVSGKEWEKMTRAEVTHATQQPPRSTSPSDGRQRRWERRCRGSGDGSDVNNIDADSGNSDFHSCPHIAEGCTAVHRSLWI